MSGWFEDFELPSIPYSNDFVERRKMKSKLERVNAEFNKFYDNKYLYRNCIVKFDPVSVIFYFTSDYLVYLLQ